MVQRDPNRSDIRPRTGTSVVRVRVGTLDAAQARELKLVLYDLAARPNSRIVVDLVDLDDRHELTVFKLVSEAARRASHPGSSLNVVHPSPRMAGYLRVAGVGHAPDGLIPADRPCDLRLDFGSLTHVACVYYGEVASDPIRRIPAQRGDVGPGCPFVDDCQAPAATLERSSVQVEE